MTGIEKRGTELKAAQFLRRLSIGVLVVAAVAAIGLAARESLVAAPAAADAARDTIFAPGDCAEEADVLISSEAGADAFGVHARGTAADAARVFGGELVSSDSREAWIKTDKNTVIQLRRLEDGSGGSWVPANQVRKVPCGPE